MLRNETDRWVNAPRLGTCCTFSLLDRESKCFTLEGYTTPVLCFICRISLQRRSAFLDNSIATRYV